MAGYPSTTALQMFLEAARRESFSKSAHPLGVTPAASSRQISALERQLGVMLFERGNRCVRLTEAGRRYQHVAARVISLLQEGCKYIEQDADPKSLRIRVDAAFYVFFLQPRITNLVHAVPELVLDIINTSPVRCDQDKGAQAWITYGQPILDRESRVERLFDFNYFPVGAPDILSSIADPIGTLTLFHDLQRTSWAPILDLQGAGRKKLPVVFGQYTICLDAAIAGCGLALGNDFHCADALSDERLMAVGNIQLPAHSSYWFVIDERLVVDETALAFRTWLFDELQQVRSVLSR